MKSLSLVASQEKQHSFCPNVAFPVAERMSRIPNMDVPFLLQGNPGRSGVQRFNNLTDGISRSHCEIALKYSSIIMCVSP